MKKITTLAVAFVMAMSMNAQEVNFKPGFKPGTTYTQTAAQVNAIEMLYEGNDEPMKQESSSTVTTTTQVGKLANNEMPFVMSMQLDENDEGAAMLNGTKILGKVKDGKPVFETVDAPNMPEDIKTMVKGMLEQGMSSVLLPAKKLKVGESFVHETPMEIPLGAVTMKMKDVATYKLLKVEGRKAFFNINHIVSMEANIEGQDMKGSGSGKGEMVYDMDQNYPVGHNAEISMEMAFVAQGMELRMKTTNSTKTTTVIAPTK